MNSSAPIPFHQASIGEEEIQSVVETLRSGWLTTGAKTQQFEKEFQSYVSAPHALAVNSCTAGLHLALSALGIGPGDEVITTPLTFCATVNTILHVGATPVLADVDECGNLDPESAAAAIGPRTRAILPVHYAGLPCRMDEIWTLAARHGLFVVEDAAHAVGTRYRGRPIGAAGDGGSASDAVAYSFYATKALTTGEGGMVTTPSADLLEKMRVLCLHGISKDAWNRYSEKGKWYYEVVACGYKYNLSDIQSAIGIAQLRKQEAFLARRAEIAAAYTALFGEIDEFETPPDTEDGRHAWHLYPLRLRSERLQIDRGQFLEELKAAGVGASVHFIPIPLHPYYRQFEWADMSRLARAADWYSRLISLPIYPDLTDTQVRRVAEVVKRIAATARPVQVAAGGPALAVR